MKVIFLTQYFPPETGAPQNRLFAMAQALRAKGAEVTVLTAMPNYPDMQVHAGYRGKWKVKEVIEGLPVIRAWIFVSKGRGIVARLLNYFSFVFSSLIVGLFNLRKSDVLLVESPPLFLGLSAMWLAKAKGAKLVFNVSDLWPESAVQLGLVTNPTLIKMSTWLEMKCYRRAALVTGQTQGIVANIKQRCPEKNVLWIPNGIDVEAIAQSSSADPSEARRKWGITSSDLVVAYAGILGHAQGLEVVLEAAKRTRDQHDIHYLLIGDGPVKQDLIALREREGLTHVRFIDRMSRAELLAAMRGIDAVVVPLRRNDLFKGAIPSKIFEALALGKPLLLGVEGEAYDLFIAHGKAGLAFAPENAEELARATLRYRDDRALAHEHGRNGEAYVRTNFDRRMITDRLWQELQTITSNA